MDCTYCFYLEKERLVQSRRMNDAVLEALIRQRLQVTPGSEVEFTWQGGEPTLLGLDFFRKAVDLQKRYANGVQVRNSIQTNGVLLDAAWGAFLAEHHFLVGLSIDGPQPLHDAYRVDRGGRPSFARVMAGLKVLQDHGVEFNTLTVVHGANSGHPDEVYDFLREIGSLYWQFIPLVERFSSQPQASGLDRPVGAVEGQLSERSVIALDWGHFLWRVFERWITEDVGVVFVQHFEVALQNFLGITPSLCLFRENCGEAVALENNGDLFSCDHYVYPEHRLGNILHRSMQALLRLPQQRYFGSQKSVTLPDYCRRCEVLRACRGECPKNRFLLTPDGEPGLNYLCQGYKLFFTRVQPFMAVLSEFLSQRQPDPKELQKWAKELLNTSARN